MSTRGVVSTVRTRESAGLWHAGFACAAIAALVFLGGIGCARPGPGTAETSDELLGQLQQDRARIDETSQTMMQRIEMFNASRGPGEPLLQFSEIFTQDLNPDQRDVLDQMLEEERDVSYRSLLQQIIADRDTIHGLQERVMHLEQTLPDKFVVVKRGDRHQDLAMTYLTGEAGLNEDRAKEHLKQIDVTDELLAGNQVWFFYDPEKDTFRTYVTAGDAGQTPVMVRRARVKKLTEERDVYKQERDTAQVQVASLEQDKSHLEEELFVRQNSLFYHADSDQSLREQGVLSTFTKRLRDVKGVSYDRSVNLDQEWVIPLDPAAYGLEEIRSVKMLPSVYQEGRDFTVEIDEDRSSARVVILDPEIFKGKEVLLAVRG